MKSLLCICGLLLPALSVADAQLRSEQVVGVEVSPQQDSVRSALPVWLSPALSAVVPGSGQLLHGQNRFAAYVAVEAFAWIRYAKNRADGRRSRTAYRGLAADVARSLFSDTRPLGDFEYYERMEKFVESGAFDMHDDIDLQPETDENTFNGFLWRRARETFWDDPTTPPEPSSPAYLRALQYYRDHAVGPEFRWSWRNAQLEHDLYKRTIGSSNEAFRRSVEDLGVIIGNHVLSTVDAFVTLRLRATGPTQNRTFGVTASLPVSLGGPPLPRGQTSKGK